MNSRMWRAVVLLLVVVLSYSVFAQQSSTAAVPPLIKFSGTIGGDSGSTVGVTFALYAEQTGGAPLWLETQNVTPDANGRYTVYLGANHANGVPLNLFASGEARWLGVQPEGQPEQTRAQLVSVPYALTAGDAQTLGGQPLSAFVMASTANGTTTASTDSTASAGSGGVVALATPQTGGTVITTGGTTGYLAKFTAATDVESSTAIYDSSTATTTGFVGIGPLNYFSPTNLPQSALHVVTQTPPAAYFDTYSGSSTTVLNIIPTVNRSARGTPTNPSAVQLNDYLAGMAARGYGATKFANGGRSALRMQAAENWTDTNQGTYMSFWTSGTGTTVSVERMRVDPFGNLGIGTQTPTSPLTVMGVIQSASGLNEAGQNVTGGFKFPDNTVQTTAFTGTAANGGVTSFNGRAGAVVPASGDYSFSLISGTATDSQIAGLSASKLTGSVAIANGGTGSMTQNFVDLTTPQNIFGGKTFTAPMTINVNTATGLTATGGTTGVSGTGGSYGLYGSSLYGYGVYGSATDTTSANYGVYGNSASVNGYGVYGSGAGTGVYGTSAGSNGWGVYGMATSTTGSNYGVFGSSTSSSGVGVYGAGSGTGVNGTSISSGGTAGVFNNAAGGKILSGLSSGSQVFSVDGTGKVTATSFSGNGAGLTGVTVSVSHDSSLTGNGSSSQLGVVYGSSSGTAAQGNDSRLSDARAPLAGSSNYIWNGGGQQNASFNITGSGTFGGSVAASAASTITTTGGGNALTVTTNPTANSSVYGIGVTGVFGNPNINTLGTNHGIVGASSAAFGSGVFGLATDPNGYAVHGMSTATTGMALGVIGTVASPSGIAGYFVNSAGGKILSGQSSGVEKFSVDGSGNVTASSFIGSGAALTGISASSLAGGTYSNAVTFSNPSNSFSGSGAGLTGITASQISGTFTAAQTITTSTGAAALTATSTSPSAAGVYGIDNSSGGTGVLGNGAIGVTGFSIGGTGVQGINQANGDGVSGTSSNGNGVYGSATATSGTTYGVYGTSASSTGTGVYGTGNVGVNGVGGNYGVRGSSSIYGVQGLSTSGAGVIGSGPTGVSGVSNNSSGYGVYGSNTGGGNGVYGISNTGVAGNFQITNNANTTNALAASTNGSGDTFFTYTSGSGSAIVADTDGTGRAGSFTINNASNSSAAVYAFTSGTGYAVYGTSTNSGSSSGGVYGSSASPNGVGVYGSVTSGNTNAGVYGISTANDGQGVVGVANSGNGAYGVFGVSSSGYAGFFTGNVHVSGTLSKSGGSFKIDHPLDPANKYLYHSFVESPDMKNIYDGVAVLDANGEAWVTLPDWFEALNRDFRYQLTSIGAPGPNLYISEEVSGNQFKIAGGTPGKKVSWQVTGIRQDAWANAHRIPVEVEKQDQESGKYIHPELFGQPETMAVHYKARMAGSKQEAQSPRQ